MNIKIKFTQPSIRHHEAILSLKNRIDKNNNDKIYQIKLNYITSRGKWHNTSWKGDESKSGGIATNIEAFFDMLQ